MRGRCAVCDRPAHRYSTADPEHALDAVACVNGLLGEIGELRGALAKIANFAHAPEARHGPIMDARDAELEAVTYVDESEALGWIRVLTAEALRSKK